MAARALHTQLYPVFLRVVFLDMLANELRVVLIDNPVQRIHETFADIVQVGPRHRPYQTIERGATFRGRPAPWNLEQEQDTKFDCAAERSGAPHDGTRQALDRS